MADVTIKSTSYGGYGVSTNDSTLLRVPPEPRNNLGAWVKSLASTSLNVASAALPGAGALLGGDMTNLLNMQIQIQKEMQVVNMISNVERSKHETEMAPIRNMRVG